MVSENYAAALEAFRRDGYVVLENFLSDAEVDSLRAEMATIIRSADFAQHPKCVFSSHEDDPQPRNTYFLDSADKISFFYEEKAVDNTLNLTVDIDKALNKVGHALHNLNPVFRSISSSTKVQTLARQLGFHDPAIVQSMYIFKQPGIGGEVTAHQDATFLSAEPIEHLVGLWFALEDATLENGCLWFVPGSHKITALPQRYVRTHEKSGPLLKFVGERPKYDHLSFVPVPVTKGSLVLIHGLVVHKSEANTSPKSRHAYTYHIVERKDTVWSKDNWLQMPEGKSFLSLY